MCLVTDRRIYRGDWEEAIVRRAGDAARAGVQLIQVRERDLETRDLLRLVTRCVETVRGTPARVVVSDRVDVALAGGAHGVHLPASGAPVARARAATPGGFLVGRSVHGAEEAVRVAASGAVDYLIFGTVFRSASKPDVEPAGIAALRQVCRGVRVPVLAIGGVTLDRLDEVAAAGAAGFAAIGLFGAASDAELRGVVQHAGAAFDRLPPQVWQ